MPSHLSQIGNALVRVTIQIDGSVLQDMYMLMEISITHQINRVPMAQVVIAESIDPERADYLIDGPDLKPGKKIDILLGYGDESEVVFKGIVVKNALRMSGSSGVEIVLDCRHELAKLTIAKKNVVYVDKKDSDAISSIIGEAGLSATVSATTLVHKQLVQYHATGWDFILSRAEINGFYLFASPDAITIGPPKYESPAVTLAYGSDILSANLELDSRNQVREVKSYAWDPKQMKLTVGASATPSLNAQGSETGEKLAQVLGNVTYNQFGSGFQDEDELKTWSSARLLRSRLSRIKGSVTSLGNNMAVIGDVITLESTSKQFNGDAYVSGVIHHVSEGKWETTYEIGLDHVPYYEQQQTTDLAAGGLLPAVSGLHIGVVKKLDSDPDSMGRVQITLPVAEGEDLNVWARLTSFYASNAVGAYFYPEVGDEVIVGFINDDPRDAIIMGSVHGKNAAPYTPEAENNTKGLVTRTKLMVTFDDKDKIITIVTPGKNSVVLDDKAKSITLTDANNNKVTLDDKGITLDSPKDINIKSKGKVAVEAVNGVEIKASGGDVKLSGLNVAAEAQVGATIKGNATAELSASGQTTVKGAMVMIN